MIVGNLGVEPNIAGNYGHFTRVIVGVIKTGVSVPNQKVINCGVKVLDDGGLVI